MHAIGDTGECVLPTETKQTVSSALYFQNRLIVETSIESIEFCIIVEFEVGNKKFVYARVV